MPAQPHSSLDRRRSRRSRTALVAAGSLLATALATIAAPAAGASTSTSSAGRIVFVGGSGTDADIYTMDEGGHGVTRLTTPGTTNYAPTWSPDGTKIAYQSAASGNADIWVMDADGTNQTRLTTSPAADMQPDWSPDGSKIVFTSARVDGATPKLWTMNADGTGQVQLTTDSSIDILPAWSPDGTRIAFSSSATNDIYVINADGTGRTQLTDATGADTSPAWSPDGSTIAFVSARSEVTNDLYTMNADGTNEQSLSGASAPAEGSPSYSPDGTTLYFDRRDTTGAPLRVFATTFPYMPYQVSEAEMQSFDAELSPAAAAPPPQTGSSTGSTSAGQSFDVAITSPATGARAATGAPATVSGTVSLSPTTSRPYHAAYVVDVSWSTGSIAPQDCNGDGVVDDADNFNSPYPGGSGDILDCEIAAVLALNSQVAQLPQATAGLVGLGGTTTPLAGSASADMSPAAGHQDWTLAALNETATARGNVETVARGLAASQLNQFTPKTAGGGTDYDSALRRMNAHFTAWPAGDTKVAYFLSDGEPSPASSFTTGSNSPVARAVQAGIRIFTYAVTAQAGGCDPNKPLRVIADMTGGTCTSFSNPSLLAASIAQLATLSSVSVSVGGTTVAATVDTTTTPASWTASLPAGFPVGTQELIATATASDGSRVSATIQVTGLAPPEVSAGGPYTVAEGSAITLAGRVTDADGSAVTTTWSPDTRLDDAASVTATYTGDDDLVEVLTVTATDSDGLTDSSAATVTTLNVAPSLGATSMSPAMPVTGSPATLSAAFIDPGALDTHSATVDWGDGTVESATVSAGQVSGTHTYASGGEYTITVILADDDGGQAQTTHGPFTVNTTPQADAGGPYSVPEGTPLQLAGTASDADGDTLALSWTPSSRLTGADTATPTYDTSDDASETLTFTADDGHLSDSDETSVIVLNVAPVLGSITGPTTAVPAGTTVEIGASFTEPAAADLVTATIDWGDGTTDTVAVTRTAIGGELLGSHLYAGSGTFTVNVTVQDDDGGSDTATYTVITNRPPTVDAGGDFTVVEGTLTPLAATALDPDGDELTLSWTPATGVVQPTTEDALFEAVDDGVVTLTLTATDSHGASASDSVDVTVTNALPELLRLAGPAGPQPVGTTVQLSGSYTDPGSLDTHSVQVSWGDGTSSAGSASGGTLSAGHAYSAPGVYTVDVQLTDDDGGTTSRAYEYVVVYDPEAGFVTGGGHIDSPTGAYRPDPTATGRATFGFVARYEKGKTVPSGRTQFQFRAGGLEFSSTSYEWLVVSGTRATYRGAGTIGNSGDYAFQLSAIDGDRTGSDGTDRLRMKIWDRVTGELVYDNQVGAADDAAPTTALTGGSIVIHS